MLKILFSCLFLLPAVLGQIYGAYNCGNGNNNYCGPSDFSTVCSVEANNAAVTAFWSYLSGLGSPADDFVSSMVFTTGDGSEDGLIPPFEFNWHGSPSLTPIAGHYTGRKALSSFFSRVFASVTDFSFDSRFSPSSNGILVLAHNCQFLVAQWEENSRVISTREPIPRAINTVKYTFLNTTTPLIAKVDVFVNNAVYQTAFCDGEVTCSSSVREL
jgi:hypothetical protein